MCAWGDRCGGVLPPPREAPLSFNSLRDPSSTEVRGSGGIRNTATPQGEEGRGSAGRKWLPSSRVGTASKTWVSCWDSPSSRGLSQEGLE